MNPPPPTAPHSIAVPRFLMGATKVLQVALGRSESDEVRVETSSPTPPLDPSVPEGSRFGAVSMWR